MQTVAEFYKYITGIDISEEEEGCYAPKKEKSFEDYLDECDYDVQIKFNYLDELLCQLDDQISETFADIQKVEIDQEVLLKMDEYYDDIVIKTEDIIAVNRERVKLTKRLNILEKRYDVVEELYEDMMFQILM